MGNPDDRIQELQEKFIEGEMTYEMFVMKVEKAIEDGIIGTINWPTSIDSGPRGEVEAKSYINPNIKKQRLDVFGVFNSMPCMFCNPPSAISSRGKRYSTCELVATKGKSSGKTVGYSCRQCIPI